MGRNLIRFIFQKDLDRLAGKYTRERTLLATSLFSVVRWRGRGISILPMTKKWMWGLAMGTHLKVLRKSQIIDRKHEFSWALLGSWANCEKNKRRGILLTSCHFNRKVMKSVFYTDTVTVVLQHSPLKSTTPILFGLSVGMFPGGTWNHDGLCIYCITIYIWPPKDTVQLDYPLRSSNTPLTKQ